MAVENWITLDDPTVTKIALYRPKATWARLDVSPFIFMYVTLHGYATYASMMENNAMYWLVLMILPCVLFLHILIFFISIWSVQWRCIISLVHVETVSEATIVRVIPMVNQGVETLVDLNLNLNSLSSYDSESPIISSNGIQEPLSSPMASFVFQKTSFWWIKMNKENDENASKDKTMEVTSKVANETIHHWCRVEYPTNSKLSSYTKCLGYSNQSQYEAGSKRWGDNTFDIPSPLFSELLAEHAVAPMFVFQVIPTCDIVIN